MIYTSVKVTIKDYKASIDNKIILYRGDKNVEVQFEIVESLYRQYKLEGSNTIDNLGASYGQLVVLKPDMSHIVSDIAPTKNGKVVFTIPESLIDESTELGSFTFQIRLYDESQSSRVTLPPVEEGLVVEEPLDLKMIVPPEEDDVPTESEGTIEINKRYIRTDTSSSTHILEAILTGSLLGKTVTWISSDTDVAEVSLYTPTACYVNVKNPGECIISARCGEYFDDCLIIVDELITDIPCTSVSIGQTKCVFSLIGQQVALNSTIKPLNTTDIIYWTSSNTSVATVSNGIVTSVGNGECTITVQCGNYSDTCSIEVEYTSEEGDNGSDDESEDTNIYCTSISILESSHTFKNLGDRLLLNLNVTPSNTTESIYWSTSDASVANVSNGVVTSIGYGRCNITARCGMFSDTCAINVEEQTNSIPCESVAISASSYSFDTVGKQVTLSATINPTNTTDSVYWSSTNNSVAIVSNGVVTAIGQGECLITVQCGNYSDTCFIEVTSGSASSNTLTDFVLTADFNVTSKNYYRVECIPIPNTITGTIWWSSSDPAVLNPSASSGKNMTFYPGKNGNCTITVTYDAGTNGYLRKKFSAVVNIADTTENVTILYDNPTITIENFKAKAVSGDSVQYFDVSYEINDGHPSYNSSLTLKDSNDTNYYLALTNKGTSPFGKNGLHLDSGAWFTEGSESSGVPYHMQQSVLSWNNFNLTVPVRNINNSVPSSLLSSALFNISQAFPDVNFVQDNSSNNTIELTDLEDAFVGFAGMNADGRSFYIILNNTMLNKTYGEYGSGNNQWLSTAVHELGHTLGPADNCAHHPSMYTYTRNKTLCTYLQPNDIAWIEYLHKEMYGVDLMTSQEEINAQVANLNLDDITPQDAVYFDYEYAMPDVVVECELEYIETKSVIISQSTGFKLDYHIYNIINEDLISGELNNKQLKIPVSQNIDINGHDRYRISLVAFKNSPYSLVHPEAIIKK